MPGFFLVRNVISNIMCGEFKYTTKMYTMHGKIIKKTPVFTGVFCVFNY